MGYFATSSFGGRWTYGEYADQRLGFGGRKCWRRTCGLSVGYLLDHAAAINTSAVGANLIMNTLVSVKDVYHTYAAHQSAGFAIRSSNPGLLDVKALNGFFSGLLSIAMESKYN